MAQTRSKFSFVFKPQGCEQELNLLTRFALARQGANGMSVITPETHPELSTMLEQVSERAKLPTPRAYVWHSDKPVANAVAMAGPRVAFSETITQILTPEELTAVAAHELGHVRNMGGSQNLGMLAGVGGMAAGWMATRPLKTLAHRLQAKDIMAGKTNSHSANALMLAKDFAIVTAAMAGAAMASRSEERAADRYGAMLMGGDGTPLISGLQKLVEHNEQNFRPSVLSRVLKPIGTLTRTHPSFEERRNALGVTQEEIAQYRATQTTAAPVTEVPATQMAADEGKWQQRVTESAERASSGPSR